MDVAIYSYVARWNSYRSLVVLKTNLADLHFYNDQGKFLYSGFKHASQ